VVDPADHPSPSQIRRPPRPAPIAVPINPSHQPALCHRPCGRIANSGKIIQPGKPVDLLRVRQVRRIDGPQIGVFGLYQLPGEKQIASHQLSATRKTPDGSGFGGCHKANRRFLPSAEPGIETVHEWRLLA